MPLINCKIDLELNSSKDRVMSTISATKFKITNTKLFVPIVTLSSQDNAKLVKFVEEGFKTYLLEYQTKTEYQTKIKTEKTIKILQGFLLMLLFKEQEDCLFLLLIILLLMLLVIQLTKTTQSLKRQSEKIFSSKNKHNKLQCTN